MDQARGGEPVAASRARPWPLISPQDVPYISNLVTDIETEMAEREDLEAMVITKRNRNANAASNSH
jgi:hypothetical protein